MLDSWSAERRPQSEASFRVDASRFGAAGGANGTACLFALGRFAQLVFGRDPKQSLATVTVAPGVERDAIEPRDHVSEIERSRPTQPRSSRLLA
jgi:hypothetical protein